MENIPKVQKQALDTGLQKLPRSPGRAGIKLLAMSAIPFTQIRPCAAGAE
ncbi:MAG TPA: hypothetical protein VM182_01495 [Terriglobia bacterium]|nr:hypothetical protein [Terriglobia bacterium]